MMLYILLVFIATVLADTESASLSTCVTEWLSTASTPLDAWVFITPETDAAPNLEVTDRAVRRRALRGLDRGQDRLIDSALVQQIVDTGVDLRTTSSWLQAVSVKIYTKRQLLALKKMRFVSKLVCVGKQAPETDTDMPIPESNVTFADKKRQQSVYGYSRDVLEALSVSEAHQMGFTGKGVLIMVVDSGFSLDHPSISRARILKQWDFVNSKIDHGAVLTLEDDNDTSGDGMQMKHGTATLSLIVGIFSGVAFDAEIILAKTESLNYEELIEEDFFVQALEWGEAQGIDLVSSSLGYNKFWEFSDYDGETSVASKAIEIAFRKGVVVVMSVGNYGEKSIATPADSRGALSVGSVNMATFQKSYFSSVGRIKPDVVGPGESVYVASHKVDPHLPENSYYRNSGTSFSCPLVAGVAALVIQAHPDWSSGQVIESIRRSASLAPNPTVERGWGFVNAIKAINYIPAENLFPEKCDIFCINGSCRNNICICEPGYYGYDCSFPYVTCDQWCKSRCYKDKCLCPDAQQGRCYNEQIPNWVCPILDYNDTRICHLYCGVTNFQDPDCKGYTIHECANATEVPIEQLTIACTRKEDEPTNEPTPAETSEPEPTPTLEPKPTPALEPTPEFLSSTSPEPSTSTPQGPSLSGDEGSVIGFATFIGAIVLFCLALSLFLRRRRRKFEAQAFELTTVV